MNALEELYEVVMSRKAMYENGEVDVESQKSYTCYLFSKGQDKILKKCGEECSETIIAAKNGKQEETVGEISDLIYHLMVMMADQNIPLDAVGGGSRSGGTQPEDRQPQDLQERGSQFVSTEKFPQAVTFSGASS